jgi:hypothetical protein
VPKQAERVNEIEWPGHGEPERISLHQVNVRTRRSPSETPARFPQHLATGVDERH